ncbi:unnamed protein product [Heterobilharzia americana]|nr:unnamed protein product [Heterobilharzia americana]
MSFEQIKQRLGNETANFQKFKDCTFELYMMILLPEVFKEEVRNHYENRQCPKDLPSEYTEDLEKLEDLIIKLSAALAVQEVNSKLGTSCNGLVTFLKESREMMLYEST